MHVCNFYFHLSVIYTVKQKYSYNTVSWKDLTFCSQYIFLANFDTKHAIIFLKYEHLLLTIQLIILQFIKS